ncbi:MAG: NUDIX domain-containing protein [Lutibacter sp.]|nr:NUDIX domain-containing protein [Lutibacter sp.]
MEDELLDLVNEQDQVIGTIWRSKAYAENRLASVRAVWFFIKNQDNKFWIPRRQATKKVLPNCLDGSAVGLVSSGETYKQAMIREIAEELNVDIISLPYRFIGTLTPQEGAICFIQVFELQVLNDFIIDYNKNDFSEYFWLSSQEIIDKINAGEKAKDSLIKIMKKFYIKNDANAKG